MEVTIDRRFDLPVSEAQAWALLENVRATSSCMPGVEITNQINEKSYQGRMRSRIGPATLNFQGTVDVLASDPAQRSLSLIGKGGDTNGSSASMSLMAQIEASSSGQGCVLSGLIKMTVSGKLAQFGHRFLLPVADSMLRDFIINFSEQAARLDAGHTERPQAKMVSSQQPMAKELNVLAMLGAMLKRWASGLLGPRP
jgi:carbon monoxide dehydrogenase subunit G